MLFAAGICSLRNISYVMLAVLFCVFLACNNQQVILFQERGQLFRDTWSSELDENFLCRLDHFSLHLWRHNDTETCNIIFNHCQLS